MAAAAERGAATARSTCAPRLRAPRRCTPTHAARRRPPPLCSYLLVEQVPGHSQLRIAEEGLQLLSGIEGAIAPVVVIGPYRSGKSFLLNQLIGVGCGALALMRHHTTL